MQNLITFEYMEMGHHCHVRVSIEHWRLAVLDKKLSLKLINDFKHTFLVCEDKFLSVALQNEFNAMCVDPLLYRKAEQVLRFIEKVEAACLKR